MGMPNSDLRYSFANNVIPPKQFYSVSFLCCLWQYFLSCRRQSQGSEISVLQTGDHSQGETAFIFAIWLPFLHQLISSCLFVQLLCTARGRKKPYGRGTAAFLRISWGSQSFPAISFLLHSTDYSQEKKKQAKKSQPTPDLTVGLEEGNKRILYIKKNLRHCSVFIVKEFVHWSWLWVAQVEIGAVVRNSSEHQPDRNQGRGAGGVKSIGNITCVLFWHPKQNKAEEQSRANLVSHTSFCLLRKPPWLSRETRPKCGQSCCGSESWAAVGSQGTFDAEEVFNWGRLSEHKSRIKELWQPFGSLCTVPKKYLSFYPQNCQTTPSKGAVVEQEWIKMLLKALSVFC